jgi:hypothetical protein
MGRILGQWDQCPRTRRMHGGGIENSKNPLHASIHSFVARSRVCSDYKDALALKRDCDII